MKKLMLMMAAPLALCAYGETPAQDQPMTEGAFKPSWESLATWECPEWFKDRACFSPKDVTKYDLANSDPQV